MLRSTHRQRRTRQLTRRRHVATGLMLCLAMVTGLLMLTATPAAAANDVQSVSPGSGSTLTSSPGEVQLVFERPLLSLVSVTVSGPAGNVAQGRAQVRGNTVVQPLTARLANGRYTVSWQLRGILDSSSGSTGFRIARKASKPTAKPTPKVSPTPKASPSPSPSRTPRPSPTPKPTRTKAVAVPIDTASTPPSSSAYVAAPQVKGVGYTGSDHLPPPIVWWGIVLVLALIGYVIKKQVDARRSAAPRMVQRMPPGLVPGRRVQRGDSQRDHVDDDGFDDDYNWPR